MIESQPENNGYTRLSPWEERLLSDTFFLVEHAERVLNDPVVRAVSDTLHEEIRLERQLEPVRHTLRAVGRELKVVSSFTSVHGYDSSTMLGVTLGRSLEDMLRDLRLVERALRTCLTSLPTPPRLRPFEREARDAWLSFYKGDPEPLDCFIRKYFVRLKNHSGPVPDELRKRVLSILDKCFIQVSFYTRGAWFLFGPAAQEQLIDFTKKTRKKFGSLTYDAGSAEELAGATLIGWEEIQQMGGSSTLLSCVDKLLRDERDQSPKLLQKAEEYPHAFGFSRESGPRGRSQFAPYEGAHSADLYEDTANADDSLALFEAREAVRQQVEALPRLVEKAAFSASEQLVFSFDSRVGTDFETEVEAGEAAARAKNCSRENVRSLRFKYRKKLKQAIASDPSFQKIFEEIAPNA
jgi:hypothetical protein